MIGHVGGGIFTVGNLGCLKHVIAIAAPEFVKANRVAAVGIGKAIRAQDIVAGASVEKMEGGKETDRLQDCSAIKHMVAQAAGVMIGDGPLESENPVVPETVT